MSVTTTTEKTTSASTPATTWIGIDEAGYGPNLGPLVVTATVWESASSLSPTSPDTSRGVAITKPKPDDLWTRLHPVVRSSAQPGDGGVIVDDSKKLYSTARGLGLLERGVLSLIGAWRPSPPTFSSLIEVVGARGAFREDSLPWYFGRDVSLPAKADRAALGDLSEQVRAQMNRSGLRLREIHSDVVLPRRFNALVSKYNSKGGVLAEVTSRLLGRALKTGSASTESLGPQVSGPPPVGTCHAPAFALVDRHGGRKNYRPLLQQTFPEDLVLCVEEHRDASRYRLNTQGRPVEISFQTGAERHLPVALASMVSKYLRELAMMLFNQFWLEHLPDLRPTAGYPVDARRFAAEIQAKQQQLGISDEVLWRVR